MPAHIYVCKYIPYNYLSVFKLNTDATIRAIVRSLNRAKGVLSDEAMKAKESNLGFTWNAYSLVTHERLRLNVISSLMFDWAHILICSDGCAEGELGLFFKSMQVAHCQSSCFQFAEWSSLITLPKSVPAIKAILTDDKLNLCLTKVDFGCTASEFLSLQPLLKRYIETFVLARGEVIKQATSMVRVLEIVETLHAIKGRHVAADHLQHMIHDYLSCFKEAYGVGFVRPKHHYLLHLPAMLRRHGTLLSCLVNERRHKVVKQYTRGRTSPNNWELGSLEEVVCFQHHECSKDWAATGLIEPHPARGSHVDVLEECFPGLEAKVANQGRVRYGTSIIGDIVWFKDGDDLHVGMLEIGVLVEGIECCMLTKYVAIRPADVAEWRGYKRTDEVCLLAWSSLLCSAPFGASKGDRILVQLPCVLRT